MLILKIIVHLLTPKSFIVLTKFSFCLNFLKKKTLSIFNTNYVLIFSRNNSFHALTIDTSSSHFSSLSTFLLSSSFSCLLLSVIEITSSYFTSFLLLFASLLTLSHFDYKFLLYFLFAFICFVINIVTLRLQVLTLLPFCFYLLRY